MSKWLRNRITNTKSAQDAHNALEEFFTDREEEAAERAATAAMANSKNASILKGVQDDGGGCGGCEAEGDCGAGPSVDPQVCLELAQSHKASAPSNNAASTRACVLS